jgi:DNA-binding transcriptional LysR family regulator
MHLKSLKIFCDVVSRRSFSRAAQDNSISQSGASQVVHQLEERLGVKLIDRSKRPLRLTAEGEVYYEGCRKLVQRYFALEEEVRTLHSEVSGRVHVASIYSVGLHHMDIYLKHFLTRYPKANVRLEYLHPHRVYEAITTDQADLGLVSYPKSTRHVEATPWFEEPMVLVCAPGHRLAGERRVPIESLEGVKMVGFDRDLTIRREIDRVLNQHHVDVDMVMEFDNIETIKRAVEIDAGVALLPAPAVASRADQGTLSVVLIDNDELVRPLGLIQRRGKELGVTARRFVELLLQSDGGLSSQSAGPDGDTLEGQQSTEAQAKQLVSP